jgi:acetyltransferase
MRFHAPVRELTVEQLIRYTQIDYDREMAFVVIDTSGNGGGAADTVQEEIRGIARYIRNPDGESCEFGIVVEDAWQGRGIGHALMEALEATARHRGIGEIIGYVLAENEDMHKLMITRGYDMQHEPDDPTVLRFVKRLTPLVSTVADGEGGRRIGAKEKL